MVILFSLPFLNIFSFVVVQWMNLFFKILKIYKTLKHFKHFQAQVSVKRITNFLLGSEIEAKAVNRDHEGGI